MTSGFGVLANQGIRVEPYLLERVLDRDGHVLETHHAGVARRRSTRAPAS